MKRSLLLIMLLLSTPLYAFEQPLQRVFQTELVFPLERRTIRFTLAPRFGSTDVQHELRLPFNIEYGITDAWLVGLTWNGFMYQLPKGGASDSGIGDVTVSSKYSFMHLNKSNTHAALALDVDLPIANLNKGHTDGLVTYFPSVIIAGEAPALHSAGLFTQAGVAFAQRLRTPSSGPMASTAYTFQLNGGFFVPFGWLRLTTEVNWANNRWNQAGTTNTLYLTPGLVCDLPGAWEVGVGAPIGLSSGADNFRIQSHLVYLLEI